MCLRDNLQLEMDEFLSQRVCGLGSKGLHAVAVEKKRGGGLVTFFGKK